MVDEISPDGTLIGYLWKVPKKMQDKLGLHSIIFVGPRNSGKTQASKAFHRDYEISNKPTHIFGSEEKLKIHNINMTIVDTAGEISKEKLKEIINKKAKKIFYTWAIIIIIDHYKGKTKNGKYFFCPDCGNELCSNESWCEKDKVYFTEKCKDCGAESPKLITCTKCVKEFDISNLEGKDASELINSRLSDCKLILNNLLEILDEFKFKKLIRLRRRPKFILLVTNKKDIRESDFDSYMFDNLRSELTNIKIHTGIEVRYDNELCDVSFLKQTGVENLMNFIAKRI